MSVVVDGPPGSPDKGRATTIPIALTATATVRVILCNNNIKNDVSWLSANSESQVIANSLE